MLNEKNVKELVILDFGTSKIKALRYKYNEFGNLTSELDFIPVSIGKLLSNNNILDTEKINILQDFKSNASSIIDYFLKENSNIQIIATEIFRQNKQLKNILKQICEKFKLQAKYCP